MTTLDTISVGIPGNGHEVVAVKSNGLSALMVRRFNALTKNYAGVVAAVCDTTTFL